MIAEITYSGVSQFAEITYTDNVFFAEITQTASQLVELTFLTTTTETGGSSTQNVFIQETQPTLDQNLLWVELNPDNSIKTFWVNTL